MKAEMYRTVGPVPAGTRTFTRVDWPKTQRTFDFRPEPEPLRMLDYVMCPECLVIDTTDGFEFDDLRDLTDEELQQIRENEDFLRDKAANGWTKPKPHTTATELNFDPERPCRWRCLNCRAAIDLGPDECLPEPELIFEGVR